LTADQLTVTEGDDVTLTCDHPANGVTEYEFKYGDVTLGKSASATHTISAATLNIDDVTHYTCVVYVGGMESHPSSPVSISLKPKTPTITVVSPAEAPYGTGSYISLTCVTESAGNMTFTFYRRDNSVVYHGSENRQVVGTESVGSESYTCVAANQAGESESSLSVTVEILDFSCPSGWTQVSNKCYRYVSKIFNYSDASKSCSEQSSSLAAVEDPNLNSKLVELGDDVAAWIGIHDLDQDGEHVLHDGSDIEHYENWDIDEPQNWNGNEFCVAMRLPSGKWNDAECVYRKPSFCEQQAAIVNCPVGWTQIGVECYKVNTQWLNYDDALAACQQEHGTLAYTWNSTSTDDFKQWTDINSLLEVWIGLSSRETPGTFVWEDAAQTPLTDTNWTNWARSSRQLAHDTSHCVALRGQNRWKHVQCHKTLPSVCQLQPGKTTRTTSHGLAPTLTADQLTVTEGDDVTLTCDHPANGVTEYEFKYGDVTLGKSASATHTISAATLNIDDVTHYTCVVYVGGMESHPSSPVSISLKPKTPTITVVSPAEAPYGTGSYISLTCVTESAGNMTFTFYRRDNSVVYHGSENRQVVGTESVGSESYTCVAANQAGESESSLSVTVEILDFSCPSGWTQVSNKCYRYVSKIFNYSDASKSCSEQSSSLAAVEDPNLNSKLVELGDDVAAWIGIHDLDQDGEHVLHDGSDIEHYENWDIDEPQNWNGNEFCVAMRLPSGKWNDAECVYRKPSFCEQQAAIVNCPVGWTQIGVECYKVNTQWLNYDDALAACQQEHGTLAYTWNSTSTDDFKQWTDINSLLEVWIGLSSRETPGTFVWEDAAQTPLTDTNWTNWARSSRHETRQCVALKGQNRWKDVQCQKTLPSVCQLQQV